MSQQLRGTHDPLFPAAFREGDEAAFDCLFREYFAPLTYFANSIVHDEKNAEDIVQDAFVILWQRRKKQSHITSITAYLYKTVRNQALKLLRKQNRSRELPAEAVTEASIEEAMIAAETARELYQVIDSLSPALQQVVRLFYLDGKTPAEIATLLDIQADTVTRQRLRALIALRKTKISL
jgi:RNA polymerase sigma-70 factor (ECF subfamily)